MLINNKRTKTGKAENKQGTYTHLVYSEHGKFWGTVNVSDLKNQKVQPQHDEYKSEGK